MGLYKFSIAAAADVSSLESKIEEARSNGANIYLHNISSIGNLNLSINDKNVTIDYDLVGTTTNSLFNWYICDTVGYETIIILYNYGTESESTFGSARYNRIYFNVKNKLVSNPKISETLAAQFNVLRGRFDSYESDGGDDDVVMLTKCVYNDNSNIETGEAIVADNLYVSTNLRSTSFKTIVKNEDSQKFINIGGIFYLPYSEEIIYHSWSKKQWILPTDSVDHEWHSATTLVSDDHKWYDADNNRNFEFQGCVYQTDKENFYKSVLRITTSRIGGAVYTNKEEIFQSSNPLIYYIVIASRGETDANQPYLNLGNYDNGYIGICFYGTNTIKIKATGQSTDKNKYFEIDKDPLKYNIYAVKFNDFVYSGSSIFYLGNASIYINGEFIRNFDNVYCGNLSLLGISNFKYVGIVEHDQTSDEIIKNSQILMDKFGIY